MLHVPPLMRPYRRAVLRQLAGSSAVLLAGPALGAAPAPDAALRAVDRLTWGARTADWQHCQQRGVAAWCREQLAARPQDALPAGVQAQIDAMELSKVSLPERWERAEQLRLRYVRSGADADRTAAFEAYQQELATHAREAVTRHLLRAVNSTAQLREQLQWFWLNHFNVFARKGPIRLLLADYEDAIRPHALGDFRALLGAVTRHPAMLVYLDNRANAAGQLNENHARELLELHTLGVDGGYTQQDVQEVARVLTGHGVRGGAGDGPRAARRRAAGEAAGDGLYRFGDARHDTGDKRVLGHTLRSRGADELDELLDLLVRHPSTARHVTRKMARFFLGTDAPAALAERMAVAFGSGDISAALAVLLRDEALLDASRPAFKDPMRYVLSSVRLLADDRPVLNSAPLQRWLVQLGQGLYLRATPDGYPDGPQAWNASGQMTARFDLARTLAGGAVPLFRAPEAGLAAATAAPRAATREDGAAQALAARAAPATREALQRASTASEWTAFLLASPDFMVR